MNNSINLEIAIVDSNMLSCIGLRQLITDIMPKVSVRIFNTFAHFTDDTPDMFIHYFVSLQVYMDHSSFFQCRLHKTIVLIGEDNFIQLKDVRMLNIHQPEKELVKHLLTLEQTGHHKHPDDARIPHWDKRQHDLTPREVEVLVMIVRGFLNKEIAERLHIGLSTVITHRKNIIDKLGTKSVSRLAIYAVMNGYIEADKI
ncbi:MAG: response regulator transcription factor [Bacteroidales bacterium]|nr:response regulator transcription factor [Bacteroidales bacterium]